MVTPGSSLTVDDELLDDLVDGSEVDEDDDFISIVDKS